MFFHHVLVISNTYYGLNSIVPQCEGFNGLFQLYLLTLIHGGLFPNVFSNTVFEYVLDKALLMAFYMS